MQAALIILKELRSKIFKLNIYFILQSFYYYDYLYFYDFSNFIKVDFFNNWLFFISK